MRGLGLLFLIVGVALIAWSIEYPPGKEVLVYYDPNAPARAFLEARFPWSSLVISSGGVALGLMGFFMFRKPDEWDYQ